MKPVRSFRSRAVVLPADHVDTDQIIPARFLTATGRDDLGDALFADWRKAPDFPLNGAADAGILVAGSNFGCGSSREHAAWALRDAGFRAVLAPSIADIFRGNAIRNGLVPVELPSEALGRIPTGAEVTVNVEAESVTLPDGSTERFALPRFGRRCLLSGLGPLDFLLENLPATDG